MKKPLILLVDDDFAVLSALEAFVGLAFGEICRVEAFDDPQEVLEAVPRWTEEGRSIAVAVVDQLMPVMTGVTLLQSLSVAAPAARMRSILLTAHPNLESALKAKNLAGAARFLEKPWKHDEMTQVIGSLLRSYLREADLLRFLRQGVVEDPATLIDVFKLRYAVYRMTPPMNLFLTPNRDEAALDAYDRRSIILGLFCREPGGEKLVGTLRLTIRGESPQLKAIRRAAAQLSEAGCDLEGEAETAFPFTKYFPDADILEAFIATLEHPGGRVAEAGRHAILAEHRKGNADRRQLAGTAAHCSQAGITHVVAGIPSHHLRHYLPLSFEAVPGVARIVEPFPGMAIWSSLERARRKMGKPIEALVTRLAEPSPGGSSLCFCPTFPDCTPGPYLSGEFRHTDLYCPKAAVRLAEKMGPEDGGAE